MTPPDPTSQLELERVLLDHLLAGDAAPLVALRAQRARANVVNRDFTPFGFFATFGFDGLVPAVAPDAFELMDVAFELVGVEAAGTAVLFVRRGRLDVLEGVILKGRWPANPRLRSVTYKTTAAASAPTRDTLALDRLFGSGT